MYKPREQKLFANCILLVVMEYTQPRMMKVFKKRAKVSKLLKACNIPSLRERSCVACAFDWTWDASHGQQNRLNCINKPGHPSWHKASSWCGKIYPCSSVEKLCLISQVMHGSDVKLTIFWTLSGQWLWEFQPSEQRSSLTTQWICSSWLAYSTNVTHKYYFTRSMLLLLSLHAEWLDGITDKSWLLCRHPTYERSQHPQNSWTRERKCY